MKKFYLLGILLLLTGCNGRINQGNNFKKTEIPNSMVEETQKEIVNPKGMTISSRYFPPKVYERLQLPKDSFGEFLRNQSLKPYGEKVFYYNGRVKRKKNVYDSVFDVDIGDRDLHQCADAIMLLRGEYLYSRELYDDIRFNFVSGFKAEYEKWKEGYRIRVDGNNVEYYKATGELNDYESFRKYMDMVFSYSSTLSLDKELESIEIKDMQIGDVFIIGGSPGHAVIIVDMAENEMGEKIFILAQSYMPAQETQILINPNDKELSPWYSLENIKEMGELITPEWSFELDDLKRF